MRLRKPLRNNKLRLWKFIQKTVTALTAEMIAMSLKKATCLLQLKHYAYHFLADRTIGRAFGTLCRLSACRLSSVCDVLYCGETVRIS